MKKYKFILTLTPRANFKRSILKSSGKVFKPGFSYDKAYSEMLQKKQFNNYTVPFKKLNEYDLYSIQSVTLDQKKTFSKKLNREFYVYKTKWVLADKASPELLTKIAVAKLTQ